MNSKRYGIVYEDDYLIVVDKAPGVLVIPTPKKETNTLTDLLNNELDSRGVEVNAYPCHRIDRETSGLIVYSKGKKAQQLLMDEFKNRRVSKRYIAVVQGTVRQDSGTIDSDIFSRNKNRYEKAVTRYRVLKRAGSLSVLEAEPVTGRTNQIRIHLKKIGHPIVGESVYAFRKDFKVRFKRVALHAAAIEFKHPVTGRAMKFTSPLPGDIEELINRKE
ncbi:MAG: RluA family pseudouridine synthase [Candidatus Omnitrophota bacterium]